MDIKSKAKRLGQLIVKYYILVIIGLVLSVGLLIYISRGVYILKGIEDVDDVYEYKYFTEHLEDEYDMYHIGYGLKEGLDGNVERIAFNIYSETNYLKDFEKSQKDLNKIGDEIEYKNEINGSYYLQEEQLREINFLVYNKETRKYLTNSKEVKDVIKSKYPKVIDEKFVKENFITREKYFFTKTLRDFQFDLTYKSLYNADGSIKEEKEVRHSDYVDNPKNYRMYFWIPEESFTKGGYYERYLTEQENAQKLMLKDKVKDNILLVLSSIIVLIFVILTIYILYKKNIIYNIKKYILDISSIPFKIAFILLVLIIFTVYKIYFMIQYNEGFLYKDSNIIFSYIYIVLMIFGLGYIIHLSFRLQEIINSTFNIDKPIKKRKYEEKNLKDLIDNFENLKEINNDAINEKVKSEKLKAELVTNISHDLKTPLTSIINYTDILLNKDISDNEKEDYLKILNVKSLKLKSLIEDLFEISKITSGKEKLNLNKVDLIELINQSLGEFSSDINKNNIEINFEASNKKVLMNLDGNKISRVFENLIGNIAKYSLRGTRAYINVEIINKDVIIIFKNISKDKLKVDNEELFNRFTRGDSSRNSKVEGNGLGLTIAKSIIELHSGKINVIIDGDLFKVEIVLSK